MPGVGLGAPTSASAVLANTVPVITTAPTNPNPRNHGLATPLSSV
jgi:hypothetical protein